MSLHRIHSNEYNLRGYAGERGYGGGASPGGRLFAALLLLAAHLAAFAAALAVAREQPPASDAQAVAALWAYVLAGLATWGAMRICRNVSVAAATSLACCLGLAAALPPPVAPHLMTLLTVAACAAAVERRQAAKPGASAVRLRPRPQQFSLRAVLGLMTVVAVIAAAARVSWPALLAEWDERITPIVTGAMFGLAIVSARLVMASASPAIPVTQRAFAAAAALVAIGCDGWLFAALGLGPAWNIATAAGLVACSLWLATAVCRNTAAPAAATIAGTEPA